MFVRCRWDLVGDVAEHQDIFRRVYVRDPEGLIVSLAEQIG